MHQEQYVIKDSYKTPMMASGATIKSLTRTRLEENITFDENNEPVIYEPDKIIELLQSKKINLNPINKEELEYEVITESKKGLFGLGAQDAKIRWVMPSTMSWSERSLKRSSSEPMAS